MFSIDSYGGGLAQLKGVGTTHGDFAPSPGGVRIAVTRDASDRADDSGTGTPATTAPASATGAASGAEAIINSRCGACHSAAPALQFRASRAAQAKAMNQHGASVSASEAQKPIDWDTH